MKSLSNRRFLFIRIGLDLLSCYLILISLTHLAQGQTTGSVGSALTELVATFAQNATKALRNVERAGSGSVKDGGKSADGDKEYQDKLKHPNLMILDMVFDMASKQLEETFSLSRIKKNREKKAMKKYFEKEKPFFALYTRENWNHSYPMVPDDTRILAVTPFNAANPIKIVIPGKYTDRVEEMKSSLLYHCDCNVIVLGWWPEVDRMQEAAHMTSDLILSFKERAWIVLEHVHIIGHGLGAHVAGMAGARVKHFAKQSVGRITGLDPSRDILMVSKSHEHILDFSDALFVDVIHSDFQNWNSLGIENPLGHVDFYSNLGNPQPGCYINPIYFVMSLDKKGKKILKKVHKDQNKYGYSSSLTCSHERAWELFMESLWNPTCSFIGVKCPDFNLLLAGICHCKASMDACAIMGINADKNKFIHVLRATKTPLFQGRWWVPTSAGRHIPYCSPNPGSLLVAENLDVEKDFSPEDKTP